MEGWPWPRQMWPAAEGSGPPGAHHLAPFVFHHPRVLDTNSFPTCPDFFPCCLWNRVWETGTAATPTRDGNETICHINATGGGDDWVNCHA